MKASIGISGVEVAGGEVGKVAAVLELVLGNGAMVSVGVEEVGRVRDARFVISLTVVSEKRWEITHKGWQ